MSSKDELKGLISRRLHRMRDSVSLRSTSTADRPQPDLCSSVSHVDKHDDETFAALHTTADISEKTTSAPGNSQCSTAHSYISLWDRACSSIHERDPKSKYVRVVSPW